MRRFTRRGLAIVGIVMVAAGVTAGAALAHTSADGGDGLPAFTEVSSACPQPPRVLDIPGPRPPLHGELVAKDASTGATAIEDFQTGKVTARSSSSMTVRSDDGTAWTWALSKDTRVRHSGAEASASAIKVGDTVLVGGSRSGDTRTARYVSDPPPDPEKLRQNLPKLRENLPMLRNKLQRPGGLHLPGPLAEGCPSA